MFSQLPLSEKDGRLFSYAGEWCGAPHANVAAVRHALLERKAAREAYEDGKPAAPVAAKCQLLRVACEGLVRALSSTKCVCAGAASLLTCADHQIAPALSDTFKKIFCSCRDPSAEETALAASEAGRAYACLRDRGIRRPEVYALCCCLSAFREDLTLADGTLSFEALRLLYKIARHVFEEEDPERALLRGRATCTIIGKTFTDPYDIILQYETWILSNSNVQSARP